MSRHNNSLHTLLGTPSSRLQLATRVPLPRAQLLPLGTCQPMGCRKDPVLSSHVPNPDPLCWGKWVVPSVPSQTQSQGSLSGSQDARRRHYLQLSQPSTTKMTLSLHFTMAEVLLNFTFLLLQVFQTEAGG